MKSINTPKIKHSYGAFNNTSACLNRCARFSATSGYRFTVLLTLVILLAGLRTLASAFPAPLSHDLAITLYPEEHRLSGGDTLTVRTDGKSPIRLTIAPAARIREVNIDSRPIQYKVDNGAIKIFPPAGVKGRMKLTILYNAWFDDQVPKQTYASDNPGYGVTGAIGPQGVFLLPGARWYPQSSELNGPVRLTVTAPGGWEAVTGGRRLARTACADSSESVWLVKQTSGGIALSAGKYVVAEKMSGDIPVYTYFYPDSAYLSKPYLNAADKYLRLYSELFGPYPFEKFAIVENFFPTGYGFPSYTVLGQTVLRLPFIIHTSLGHEIAHCWWGNGVQVDYRSGNWSEGLTTYVADYLYQETDSAEAARQYRMKILRDYAVLTSENNDIPLRDFQERVSPVTKVIGYGKGAMVFHMARRLIGEEAFWGGLRDIFRTKLFQPVSWEDFAAAFEKRTGRDLSPFFDQWVNRSGAPLLSLDGVEAERMGSAWAVSGKITQSGPLFDVQTPLRLRAGSASVELIKRLKTGAESFSIPSESAPLELAADPDVDLFRRLHQEEIAPIVNSLRDTGDMVVILSRDVSPETVAAAKVILESLGKASAPILRESDASKAAIRDKNVLVVGFPSKQCELQADAPEMEIKPDGFTLRGQTFRNPGDCLFAVFKNPYNPDKTTALFYPLSSSAATPVAKKIRHYGTYSYLIFRNGENIEKGLWEVQTSPLIHRFK